MPSPKDNSNVAASSQQKWAKAARAMIISGKSESSAEKLASNLVRLKKKEK